MTAPSKINFKIYQGSTFTEVLRWESSTKIYVPITNISKTAPMIVTAPSHGIPVGWRAKITNVVGMKEVNDSENYHLVTDTTTDTVTFNAVNAVGFSTYTSGGILEYNEPVPLAGYTARMQLREKLTSETVLLELTTENGYIDIDTAAYTITLNVPASITEDLSFKSAVYSLELVANSIVIPFANGTITLVSEVTR